MILSLLFVVATTMMAEIEIGTEYRIKEKSTNLYLNVGGTSANTHGEVYGTYQKKEGEEANVQIFTFSDAGSGKFYLKSNSGEYITSIGEGVGWNVNADPSKDNALALNFVEVGVNEYKIMCYNQSKGADKYFKWEYVGASSKYHAFNDSDAGAVFVLEKVNLQEKDFVSSLYENGTFNAEIYIRLLCVGDYNFYYVGYACGNNKITAFLVDGITGDIIAGKN